MALSADSQTRDSGSSPRGTLLFVDDEQRVLTSMRAMFRRDYKVFVADCGRLALDILDKENIDVVVSDQRMPEMTGTEVLSAAKERAPETTRILLTGYADLEAVEASINESEVFRYLMKPCPPDELKAAVELALETARGGTAQEAQLIQFPDKHLNRKPPEAPAPAQAVQAAVAQSAPPRQRQKAAAASAAAAADILVLTMDRTLYGAVKKAVGSSHNVHQAHSIDRAVVALEERPIGVMVTDITVEGKEVEALTRQLKELVPDLVTIVASERSDALSLIGLINDGQIYRFLLKPVAKGQCSLWLNSAVRKFGELQSAPRRRGLSPGGTGQSLPPFFDKLMTTVTDMFGRFAGNR